MDVAVEVRDVVQVRGSNRTWHADDDEMVCWATKSNLSPVELEPSRKCHLLDFQLCENIATGSAVLTCENTATDFSVSNRKDDEPCTVYKVWCSVYTECSAQKKNTRHEPRWPLAKMV